MLDVYFEKEEEMILLGDVLGKKRTTKNQSPGNWIRIEEEDFDVVSKALTYVFQRHRLYHLLTDIITNVYYYTDEEEIERIHDLTIGMFAGEPLHMEVPSHEETLSGTALKYIFADSIQGKIEVNFDSIIQLCMPQIHELAVYMVGLAIDEYKREEDHQALVHTLREHVTIKRTGINVIHVLQGESFRFYSESGMLYNRTDLLSILKAEQLVFNGLPMNEWNLSPLIALNPSVIYFYGDDPSEYKTQTIINVFQERVRFKRMSDFPFSYIQKNQNDA